MQDNRKSLLNKIRALLAKTVENGCTEAEALSALSMAQALMDAYEVTDVDLELGGETATVTDHNVSDPKNINNRLAVVISQFCDVKVWRNRSKGLTFVGLQSDVDLAIWMLDSLNHFVRNQLASYLFANARKFEPGRKGLHIKGFVLGCCNRINERLRELINNKKKSTNKNALVIIKHDLIKKKMNELNINLTKGRNKGSRVDDNGYNAGRRAGDGASFGRPVNNGQTVFMIGKK